MNFDDRLSYFILGVIIGFAVGYYLKCIRTIEEQLKEVDDVVVKHKNPAEIKKPPPTETRKRQTKFNQFALLVAALLTAGGAFMSQQAWQSTKETQEETDRTQQCIETVFSELLGAVNARTTYASEQVNSNVELQEALLVYLNEIRREPPPNDDEQEAAASRYVAALKEFIRFSAKAEAKREEIPYPTVRQLESCIEEARD